jgi:hypothetical protein
MLPCYRRRIAARSSDAQGNDRASNPEVGIPSNIEVEVAAALQTRSGPTESTLPGEKSDRVPGGANL